MQFSFPWETDRERRKDVPKVMSANAKDLGMGNPGSQDCYRSGCGEGTGGGITGFQKWSCGPGPRVRSAARPCRVRGGVPNPGTGNPLGLVHSGAGMGQPPDVLHRQDEVLGRLEQLDRFIVQDVEKALSVHLQNLVPNLPRPPNNTVTWAARRTPTHARGFRALMPACRGGY